MNSCREFNLEDIMAITAIPVSKYTDNTTILSPVIPESGFTPVIDDTAVVIGRTYATGSATGNPVGALVPIISESGKVKDAESDKTSGRAHAVSVNCKVDDRESDAWEILRRLERTPSHLILLFRGETRAFVRATEDTYVCTVERDGKDTSVSFKIHGLMGIQLIA